ncbi:MAG: DedA family protein [Gammaproteobacteria bacterium]|nr:DedA family protein [Gammaproteobacteria bacterium]
MKLFSALYERVMRWAAHQHAPWYLGGLSFAESSFFPIPPDTMLAPMSLAKPKKAWSFALITTVTSVIGGLLGYVIGAFFFPYVEPILHNYHQWDKFLLTQALFNEYGFWFIFIAGFTPIPYKLFTISAGVLNMAIIPFVMASLVGRGARFFLVAGLMVAGGERMEKVLRKWVDIAGWLVVVIILIAYLLTSP